MARVMLILNLEPVYVVTFPVQEAEQAVRVVPVVAIRLRFGLPVRIAHSITTVLQQAVPVLEPAEQSRFNY